jgi:hypothetical protein
MHLTSDAQATFLFLMFCGAVLQVPVTLPRTGFFISKTEVPAFIPRDDMMDQILRWALIEAEEGGQRNFGMPMKVQLCFHWLTQCFHSRAACFGTAAWLAVRMLAGAAAT